MENDRDRDLMAAELALGLLEGDALARARLMLLADPSFRASYAYWQSVSGEWLETVEPVGGPVDLLPAIEAAIDASGEPGVRGVPEPPARARPAFAWAIAASIVALVASAAAVVFYQRGSDARRDGAELAQQLAQAEGERQVAQISGNADGVLVSAIYDPSGGTIQLRLDIARSDDKVPELWVIPPDGKPRSLGTFSNSTATLSIAPELRPLLIDGATLAVTMEPATGAPHAAPSGPVLGATELRTL